VSRKSGTGGACALFVGVRMSDVMSTSVESLMIDAAELDDEPSLVSSEQEPEAWSVTVDLKTLKKMTAKNIKRQDHIWGQSVSHSVSHRVDYMDYSLAHRRAFYFVYAIQRCSLWSPYGIGQTIIFMVALCNRADHYIFALWFLSSFYLLFLFLA